MKLVIQPLEVLETDGFKQDVFGRQAYGQALRNIIAESEDALVICLNGRWGEGKTTFVRMWQGLLSESKISSIYIDAFANDYVGDSFFSVASAIKDFVEKSDIKPTQKENFAKQTKKVGAQLLSLGTKVAIKAATLGALTAADVDALVSIKDDVAEGIAGTVSKLVEDKLASHSQALALVESYRKLLSEIPSQLGNGSVHRLVIIVDELDRCKPTFSVNLLEQIKHLFSVPNVTFVLVMNKEQLQESIKSVYGQGVNASEYLQKFINLETRLPKRGDGQGDDIAIYVKQLYSAHSLQGLPNRSTVIDCATMLAKHFDLSLRQLERVFTNIAILYGVVDPRSAGQFTPLIVFLAVVKVIDGGVFTKLSSKLMNYETLVSSLDLTKVPPSSSRAITRLFNFVRYALISEHDLHNLGPEHELNKSIAPLFANFDVERPDLIPFLAKQLTSFTMA